MRSGSVTIAYLVGFALLASGCTMLGPDYEDPEPPLEIEWLAYEDPLLDTTSTAAPKWWQEAFSDPVLDTLVQTALDENLTRRSAGLRVLQAREQLAIAIGNQYPQQQDVSGSAGTGRQNDRTDEIYDLGFSVSWEADVWGRFRRQVESASAALDATLASYDGITISLIADVARTYLLIRTTQRRLDVARYNVGLQKQNVEITTAKFEGGATSALDVEQAQTLLYNTIASVSDLESQLRQFTNSLAVLLGRPPGDLGPILGATKPIPAVRPEVAVGMPQDLIRRRPDIRVAERQLAAQSAQIGFAITELYPHFGLSGSIGTTANTRLNQDYDDLFSDATFRYNLTAGFRWDVLNYGRLRSNVRLQDAFFQQLLEDYRQTVLSAQADVENSIVAYLKSQDQLNATRSAAQAAERAADISQIQYQDGLTNFNTVITTLVSLANQQDLLAATEGTVATNLVDVYRAIGGGWEVRPSADPVDLIPEETREELQERTKYWDKALAD
jgi:NodT family efflux transporter outer membrane factor (OMF) lipoprotein